MGTQEKIFVIGHKNPDTDSICSAIAYADIKNQKSLVKKYIPKRAGQINEETQYVLNRFGVQPPAYLGNGLSGLVHISQICEKRIKKPSEVLTVGDTVKVKVISVKDGKLSLSIKEASDLMAKDVEEETFEIPDSGEQATTSLGSLFANIKL